MAQATVASGKKLKIKVGDGASPEVFTTICGLTNRSIAFEKAMNDIILPDCADDEAVPSVAREAASRSVSVSGDGVLHLPALATWRTWYEDNESKQVQIWIDVPSASGGGYWQGAFHLASITFGGELGNKIAVTGVSIVSDGDAVWTAAP